MSKEIIAKLEEVDGAYRAKFDSLEARVRDVETAGARTAALGGSVGTSTKWTRELSAGVAAFVRRGEEKGILDIQASSSVGSDPDGGFLVRPEYAERINLALRNVSPMRQLARVENTTSDAWEELFSTGPSTSGWVSETASRPETATPQLVVLRYPVEEVYAAPAATQKLLDDAQNAEQWLTDSITLSFGEREGTSFVSGTGVGQPRGILSYTIVSTSDKAGRAFGQIQYIPTGAASTFVTPSATASPADCLKATVQSLKPGYRSNGAWQMNAATAGVVSQFKDAQGRFIWVDGIEAGQPPRLLGYPVYENEDMPDVGANAYPIAFGDWKRAYLIVDRNIRLLRDPYTSKPKVVFYSTKRIGAGLYDSQALKLVKVAVS